MEISTSIFPESSQLHPTLKNKLLHPLRQWLDSIDVRDPQLAKMLCLLIPAQCPFERDICLWGHQLFHIPPLCKLNPVYDQLVWLRFRALSFLADVCGEDVTPYC
ncbi:MAG TPA: Mo-dependent nitrogenase C-terminal domain-containing protein [Kamptonema sp.]|nr:Mo-dependent nitrogenase C-terminal domain-containing protein [Kamptonema sp.]